jgi:hypothetical protein
MTKNYVCNALELFEDRFTDVAAWCMHEHDCLNLQMRRQECLVLYQLLAIGFQLSAGSWSSELEAGSWKLEAASVKLIADS